MLSKLNQTNMLWRRVLAANNSPKKYMVNMQWYTTVSSAKKGQSISLSNLNDEVNHHQLEPHEPNKTKLDLTFEDSKTAFKAKSNFELLRGYLVFQLCSFSFLIENQKKIMAISRKLLGKRLFSQMMKMTFYGHFVAGEDQQGIKPNVERMMKYGVKSILDYSAEEDLAHESIKEGESSELAMNTASGAARKIYNPFEIQCEKNKKIFMECIDAVSGVTCGTGIAALKVTSLMRPALLLKFSTLCDQFHTSGNRVNQDLLKWSNLMSWSEQDFVKNFNSVDGLDVKFGGKQEFTDNEIGEIRNLLLRVNEIIQHAVDKNVRVFIDAEQTYFQGAINRMQTELMRQFNRSRCVVLGTYQNYLRSAFDTLKDDLERSIRENYFFGAKLVRGAYMEQERERARQMGYADPINVDYDATTRMYEKSFLYCLDEIKKHPLGRISVMIASHNEDTVRFAVKKMEEYGIKPGDRVICFGQLLGMCDYISFYLGGIGYSVYKYVPYGPVEEVLPYLSRRANENRGIFDKVKKEKRLIWNELKRRALSLDR